MLFQVIHVMCGLENFHPAGSWNGWMMTNDCIMNRPLMMWSYHLVFFRYFNKLWTIYFHVKELWFVTMDPTGTLMLICKALWTLLRERFNAYIRSSLWVLLGVNPATLNGMILYYRLMTKWSGLGDSTELPQMGLSQSTSARWVVDPSRCFFLGC
jgi:hypothetical protein